MERFLENDDNFVAYDMGEVDEQDRPFMIVDKDSGKIFDMRDDG